MAFKLTFSDFYSMHYKEAIRSSLFFLVVWFGVPVWFCKCNFLCPVFLLFFFFFFVSLCFPFVLAGLTEFIAPPHPDPCTMSKVRLSFSSALELKFLLIPHYTWSLS